MHRLLLVLFLAALSLQPAAAAPGCFVYVGTYTDRGLLGKPSANAPGALSKGIYVFRFDTTTGKLTPLGLAAETPNPTYITFSASGKFLYAVNEIYQYRGEPSGAIGAYSIDPANGHLTLLNQVPAHGTGPCHAVIDQTGRNLLAANFGSGSVAVFPLNPDGTLRPASSFSQDTGKGPNSRQDGPHSHAINLTPDNRFAIASEFGTDRLRIFRFDASAGTLTPAEPPRVPMKPASAPRHLAFHPNGKFAYSLNEIDSTVTVLAYDGAKGSFRQLQNLSALPAGFRDFNTAAEVIAHPSGKFLYTSNRGHHSIAVFAIEADGTLRILAHAPCGGKTPRGFSIDSSGRWLIAAGQSTHNIAVFAIDPVTGIPTPTGETAPVHTPTGVKFLELRE
ncbi:MAG TPA: lactonase family protein [Opitutaceae bacterium]|nr:lactonase family protein [Opitutaceae bacterium]